MILAPTVSVLWKVHPDFHWPNILGTNFCEFQWQFFEFFCKFWESFLQWLHLNNLCCESIAQDGMQASQIFSQWLHLNNLTWSVKLALNLSYFGDHVFANWIATNGQRTFLSVKVGWHTLKGPQTFATFPLLSCFDFKLNSLSNNKSVVLLETSKLVGTKQHKKMATDCSVTRFGCFLNVLVSSYLTKVAQTSAYFLG